MFKSRYSNFLTIVLVIAIILILSIITIIGVNVYKKYKSDKEADSIVSQFQNNVNENNTNTNSSGQGLVEQNIPTNNTDNTTSTEGSRKVTYYNNFVMIGYIEIPKIGKNLPILETETVESLEQSVVVRYPSKNPKLNEVGNIVIAGHNYVNGQFFSDLYKVASGDIIRITDTEGRTLTYTVYEKYETTPEDTAYMRRDVGNNIEITLVTCTNNSKARIIVKAKVKE